MTQSNSLLLCDLKESPETAESECALQVRSNVAQIWELTPTVARTGRIAQLLGDSLFQGAEEEKHSIDEVSEAICGVVIPWQKPCSSELRCWTGR
jgi:hypothetical protein